MRDQEAAEDFFNARYFTPTLGRFNSADPGNAGADFVSAQSWNGYAYVLGNPLNSVDPSGMVASGPNPAAVVSWHQVGMAVDLSTKGGNFQAVMNAMEGQGLTWGGTFRQPDPVHFQLPPAGTTPPAQMVQACEAQAANQ